MADESDREEVALFTKPQGTYTGDAGSSPRKQEHNNVADGKTADSYQERPFTQPGDANQPNESRDDPGGFYPALEDSLSQVHEKAISAAGFGRLQWLLFLVVGLAMMGDFIEVLVVAFVLPGAEKDLCMNSQMKGWLGAIAFAGMMIGSVLWGNLADKMGRRLTLWLAMAINVFFSFFGAFMPVYWIFLVCRLISGIGIGGSLPLVIVYFSEFCPKTRRGRHMGILLIWWVAGGVYVAALGWLVIPHIEMNFTIGGMVFNSWRVFLLLCVIPAFLSIIGLVFMPESPRFLMQAGHDLDALAVYRRIYMWNHSGEPGAEYEMPEIEIPNHEVRVRSSSQPDEDCCQRMVYGFENFWNSIFVLFFSPLTMVTILLSITWFSLAFGFYGIDIWFPEYMKKLQQEEYFAKKYVTRNLTLHDEIRSGTMENIKFMESTYYNVTFQNLVLTHVTFEKCQFTGCTFQNVTARKTFFVQSLIRDSIVNYTNFYDEKFQQTKLINTTILNTKQGCTVDFDVNFSARTVYLEAFLGQLAVVPGTILAAFLMDKLGRVKVMVTGSLFASGVSAFFIWFAWTEAAVVAMNCVFNAVVVGAWNCLEVMTPEQFPTHVRATASGFVACLARVAAILGNVAFGNLIDVNKAVPILLAAVVMAVSGLLSLKLPESKDHLL